MRPRCTAVAFMLSTAFVGSGAVLAAPPITSDFEADADGWLCKADSSETLAPTHTPNDGNPGGSIQCADFGTGSWFFMAPAKFLGDVSFALGGELRFDLRSTNGASASTEVDDVLLIGDGLKLQLQIPPADQPGTAWRRYAIPLNESAGWTLSGGAAATDADIALTLTGLKGLYIRGDWLTSGPDIGHLDNVVLAGTPCAEDLNANGVVDFADLNIVLSNYATSGPEGDVNDDGQVDFLDLNRILGVYLSEC